MMYGRVPQQIKKSSTLETVPQFNTNFVSGQRRSVVVEARSLPGLLDVFLLGNGQEAGLWADDLFEVLTRSAAT